MVEPETPLCPHLSVCSGCPEMHRNYADQLVHKQSLVRDAFLGEGFDEGNLAKVLKSCVSSPKTLRYRNKAKWVVSSSVSDEQEIIAGIYAQGTHDVVPIPNCVVHGPRINEMTEFLRVEMIKRKIPVFCSRRGVEGVRHIIVRYSFHQKKSLVVIVTSQKNVADLGEWVQGFVEQFRSELVGVVQNINSSAGNAVLGAKNKYLYHKGELVEKFGPFSVVVGPLSFLQVNSFTAELIYKKVKKLIGKGPHRFGIDLYSGIGLMGMHLAAQTERILAIEELQAASEAGAVSARRNGIQNIETQCGDVAKILNPKQLSSRNVDWLILNPPRKGCDKIVLKKVAELGPKKIVYVSCNPATLARDCELLSQNGFTLKVVEPHDMFPQTAHVETVVLLERAKKLPS